MLLRRCLAARRFAFALLTLFPVALGLFVSPLCCQLVCTDCGEDNDDCPVCLVAHVPTAATETLVDFGPPAPVVVGALPVAHAIQFSNDDHPLLPGRGPPAVHRFSTG